MENTPFREGNTRTITTFLYFHITSNGYYFNMELLKTHAKYFRNALLLASIDEYSEYSHLENILTDSIWRNEIIKINYESKITKKYKQINGYDLDDYSYNYHEIKE